MTLILSKHFTDCLPIGTAISFFLFSSLEEIYTFKQEQNEEWHRMCREREREKGTDEK